MDNSDTYAQNYKKLSTFYPHFSQNFFFTKYFIKILQLFYKILLKKWLYLVLFYKINIFFLIIIKNYIIYMYIYNIQHTTQIYNNILNTF